MSYHLANGDVMRTLRRPALVLSWCILLAIGTAIHARGPAAPERLRHDTAGAAPDGLTGVPAPQAAPPGARPDRARAVAGQAPARVRPVRQPAGARTARNVSALDAPAPGARSPRNASYSIDVTLDHGRRLLTGREVVTWRNIAPVTTGELQFHLYWNAWRNTDSTWLRERALAGTLEPLVRGRRLEDWGWTNVTAVRLLGAGAAPPIDLGSSRRFIAPDGNLADTTVLQVRLPALVQPGETVNVEIEWTAQVPRTFARTGGVGDYYFFAQWFPKIGVLEADGWNTRQFHAGTEFYADYGVYDVRMRVPTGWVVGATGREQSRRDNGDGTTTHRYTEADVHDFAWTTSPRYQERRERFEHQGLPPVDMRLLLQPEHASQAARHFDATRAALRYYGEWFGPYPYGHVTVIDPAWQSGAGGMEYPTLFTAGTRWLAPAAVTQPESVTVHEAGHQFWYGIVGNDEFEHAWLDEGLNTFSTARVLAEAGMRNHLQERFFGGFVPWVFRDIPLSRVEVEGWERYRLAARSDTPATPSWQYFQATGAAITYSKTALWLHTLENLLGWPTLQRAMSTFFARASFRHPEPEDFFRAVNEAAGRDMTWFFDEVYGASNVVDYGVDRLASDRVEARGFAEGDGRVVPLAPADADARVHRTTVVARRYGEAVFPVDLVVTFEDGSVARERWDGRERWRAFTFERPVRASRAVVDPDGTLVLDVDRTNNGRAIEPASGRAATKWALQWIVWFQDLLMTYGH